MRLRVSVSGTDVDDHPQLHDALERGRLFWKIPGNVEKILQENLEADLCMYIYRMTRFTSRYSPVNFSHWGCLLKINSWF